MYLSKKPGKQLFSVSESRRSVHDVAKGAQPMSVSLMNKIPARLTVAGVAFLKDSISNTILIAGVSGILSLDTNVKTLLSS